MSRKLKVLQELIDAHIIPRQWFDHPLPQGYTTTGMLHHWDCGGSGARTRIDELRKAGIDIRYKCFQYIEKKTGVLTDPEELGISIDNEKMIEKLFYRVRDGFNKPIDCHAYCLFTPVNRIDAETGKLILGIFEQSTMEF